MQWASGTKTGHFRPAHGGTFPTCRTSHRVMTRVARAKASLPKVRPVDNFEGGPAFMLRWQEFCRRPRSVASSLCRDPGCRECSSVTASPAATSRMVPASDGGSLLGAACLRICFPIRGDAGLRRHRRGLHSAADLAACRMGDQGGKTPASTCCCEKPIALKPDEIDRDHRSRRDRNKVLVISKRLW